MWPMMGPMPNLPTEQLEALWSAAGAQDPMPALEGDAVAALAQLVDAMERGELESRGWTRWRIDEEADPYPAIAFADSGYALLVAAVQVAGLLPLQCEALQDMTLYVDPIPGPGGEIRALLRDEELLPGLPHSQFTTLDETLRWMTLVSSGADRSSMSLSPLQGAPDPNTGGGVLEAIVGLEAIAGASLGGVWRAAANRDASELRVAPEAAVTIDPGDRSPGWGRRVCLWVLHKLLQGSPIPAAGELEEPQMTAPQRAFIDHLRQLELALGGEVPDLVTDTMNGSNDALAARAADWLDAFEQAEDEADAEPQGFEQVMNSVLLRVLADLEAEELLEVEAGSMPALAAELTTLAADAPTPKKMLKILVEAVVESDLVEEVYADDNTLAERFARAFGSL